MTKQIEQKLVEDFYFEVWNERNHIKAHEILSDDFIFRGSLGDKKKGVNGFIDYMGNVHHALFNYKCFILNLIISKGKAAAQMKFEGIHQNIFMGVKPTRKQIEWNGAAFFDIEESKIKSLWVLGDIDAIKKQLL